MESSRKKCREFVHIGSLVKEVFQSCRSGADAEMLQVWNVWKSTVGDAVAENARPAAFKADLLLVNVSSSPWLQQLRFLKEDLIIRLNQALKKELIRDIKFRIGPLS